MSSTENPYQLNGANDYPFVPSTEENRRLEEQSSAYNELMLGDFSRAPVKAPKKILDIGCGTGIQTRLLAEKYPDAIVVGIDPSPVPEADKFPHNVKFILGRFEELAGKHGFLQPTTFDLIYQRMLIMVVRGWEEHVKLTKSLLRPGGWFEAQEIAIHRVLDADGQLISRDWQFLKVMKRGLAETGFDFEIAPKIADICRKCGFVDAEMRSFIMPFRPWKERPEAERLADYIQWGYPTFFRAMIARSARPEEGEDPQKLYRDVEDKMLKSPIGHHGTIDVTVARKPAE